MQEQNYLEKSDQELVELSLKNKDSYGFLVQKYENKLNRYILRFSGLRQEDAEDVLQDVFVKVYKNLNDYDPKLKFSSWIYRITHNETITFLRKVKRRPTTYEFDIDAVKVKTLKQELNMEKDVDDKNTAVHILKMINNLPPKHKDVIFLRYIEDKDYKEISDILKKPQGTVATLLKQAKEQLKVQITKNNHLFN
jgi:RNA polymerase sigma-70 factor (ECF subfamily)